MKKRFFYSAALAGVMAFSVFSPTALAHDELGKDYIEKGDDVGQYEFMGPTMESSKNILGWKEAASVQIQKKNGVQNNTADVYAHKGYAYLGTHTANGGGGGVRVFDLKDPSNPKEVAVFADLPGTWQEKVIVKSVSTPEFTGDLAVVSVQKLNRLDPNTKGGFLLYDVTNPEAPKKLGFWATPQNVRGTHELYLTEQGNRVLVLTANPYSNFYDKSSHDFNVIDATNPAAPKTVYSFDAAQLEPEYDGYNFKDEYGQHRVGFAHSVKTDGNGSTAYVSFWDMGTLIFDISKPEATKFLGRTEFDKNVQGAAHSSALAKGGNVLIETREVANPKRDGFEYGYGYTRIYDIKDKKNPKLLSYFKTEESLTPGDKPTFAYTVHDPKVRGNTLYLSHYAAGIRALDITNPSAPYELGHYRPENAYFWGVFIDRNYMLASDMGNGLKVVLKNNGQNE
ncbi:LVIVD repeat-containing protein [Fictibacillus iocasae]|uniref:LVIVD repeat-containing protein n=1 Tax=Fictibacillus iocasae TaxID=2715437 RepID=A0ABW2NQZ9_9BACL